MQATELRPVDRFAENYLQRVRDVVELSHVNDAETIPPELLERLELRDLGPYPGDEARELADEMLYAIERHAVVQDDGTAGELRYVELLLGGGGPTITLNMKLRDDEVRSAEFWHSWGATTGVEATATVSHTQHELLTEFLDLLGVVA